MRQQAKKLFYITKQLISNNLPQTLQALTQSRTFILNHPSPQYLNTLLMSLLDLFTTTKHTTIRYIISTLIPLTQGIIGTLPSRMEFMGMLVEVVRGGDWVGRVLGLGIVGGVRGMFGRDGSVYHFLLGRLGGRGEVMRGVRGDGSGGRDLMCVREFVEIVKCLRLLLESSQYLASIFSNNLKQLHQLGNIDLKIISYLCLYSKFTPKSYQKILKQMHQLWQPHYHTNPKFYKKFLSRLTIKSCYNNYMCIRYYEDVLKGTLPGILGKIWRIRGMCYGFMVEEKEKEGEGEGQREGDMEGNGRGNGKEILRKFKCEELLDFCYESYSLSGNITNEIQEEVKRRILEDIEKKKVTVNTILLTFYCSNTTRANLKIDQTLSQPLTSNPIHPNPTTLLKISLTTLNLPLSKTLLNLLSNQDSTLKLSQRNTSIILLFSLYCDLHLEPCNQNLVGFLVVAGNFARCGRHRILEEVVGKWGREYVGVGGGGRNGGNGGLEEIWEYGVEVEGKGQVGEVGEGVKMDEQGYNDLIKCEEQIEIMRSDSIISLPFWDKQQQPFYKIYFGKQTILDIFKYL